MRIINCRKHKATKQYVYYDGIISKGDTYFRGFAVNDAKIPFEFMFTNNKFYDQGKVPMQILIDEFDIYYSKRRVNKSDKI